MLKVATVCTGIGSPEKAIENLGIPHEIVFGCEIDKYARQTYLANFNPDFMVPDMTKESWEGEKFYSDLFIGGIPCQAFSLAGKRLGELDPRGLLFFDFYRYVKNQNPKYFIIENVKGLLSDNNGATFQNWINLLGQSVNGDPFMFPHEDSLMYNLHWQVLNTKDYGLPQNRERVFLIGIRNDLPNSFVFPKGVPLKLRLKDILEPEVDEKYYLSEKMLELLTYENKGRTEIANINKGGQKGSVISEDSTHVGCLSATDYKLPKLIQVQSATKSGFEIATEGSQRIAGWFENENVIGAYRDDAKRSSVSEHIYQKENSVCNTIQCAHVPKVIQGGKWQVASVDCETTSCNQGVMVSNEVRAQESKIQRRITGTNDFRGKEIVFKEQNYMNCLQTGLTNDHFIKTDYRIRKLTPKECFRLQGFPDEFLQNAIDAGVSNSQLYKQAGNSISVPVIQAILKNLLT